MSYNQLVKKNSFYNRLYALVHDTVDSESLLQLLDVQIVDHLKDENPEAAKIINDGAEIIGKFVFVSQHLGEYFADMVKDSGKDPFDPHVDFWHIQDQLSEVWIEALHSLLAVRTGLVKQGIYTLRRCYELSIFGTFYSSTFVKLDSGKQMNPFIELSGYGLWIKNLGKRVVRKDIEGLEKQIKTERGIQASAARQELYSNFTRYYITGLCKGLCDVHKKEIENDNIVILALDSSFSLDCLKCRNAANFAVVERPVMLESMVDITKVKLGLLDEYGSEFSNLYDELSALLHPNNPGHQHQPEFKKETLQNWLTTLQRILRLSMVVYSRGLSYIGYKDEATFSLLELHKYVLGKIGLKELYFAICQKVGAEFNRRNPDIRYEDDDHKMPSYLEGKD